jgi:hypothetical protein
LSPSGFSRCSAAWFGLCAFAALGCFSATLDHDELDAKASGVEATVESLDPATAADAGPGYTVSLDTPPIELDFEGEDTTRDPCVATTEQARAILERNCSGCHAPPAGMGGFRAILDFPVLVTATSSTQRNPVTGEPVRLVVPGDPEGSRLYRRAAAGEMPPMRDASLPALPRPTISDISVLREWIESCLPTDPAPAPPIDAGLP